METAVKERDQVSIEVFARKDVVLACVVVIISASLNGTAASVVLEHNRNGVLSPTLII